MEILKHQNNSRVCSQITLAQIIDHLDRNTKEEDWCVDVVRTKDGSQNCLFGHLANYGGMKLYHDFEMIATEFMVYPINDGKNPNYPQETPKQRVLAYLKNIEAGIEKTTTDWEEFYFQEIKSGRM